MPHILYAPDEDAFIRSPLLLLSTVKPLPCQSTDTGDVVNEIYAIGTCSSVIDFNSTYRFMLIMIVEIDTFCKGKVPEFHSKGKIRFTRSMVDPDDRVNTIALILLDLWPSQFNL